MSRLHLPPRALDARRRRIWAVCGRCSFPPTLGAMAQGRALGLLCCRRLEQRLQLLAHSSLLGGHRSGKVLQCSPEEWRYVSVSVDIHALVDASVVVACRPARWRRRCAVVRLFGSRTVLTLVAIPLRGSSCTGMSSAGRRSRGSTSMPSSW
jgi:hypothetical protein